MPATGCRSAFVLAGLWACGATGAGAAGLSAAQTGTVLGQPLDFAVQVRLDPGDSLSADCVGAEVHLPDQRVPPSMVRALIDQQGNGSARVRVQTQQAIDEPVVSIILRVGCAAPITRRFVVFADPPLGAPAPTPQPPAVPAAALAPALAGATQADAGGTAALAQPPRQSVAGPATANGPPAAAVPGAVARPAVAVVRAPRPQPAAATRPPQQRAAMSRSTQPAVAAAAAPSAARLTLEPAWQRPAPVADTNRAESDAVSAALAAVAQAASAAQVTALAASASIDRIANLERTVAQLRNEAQANQQLVARLRDGQPTGVGGALWMWPLLVLALALAGLAAWLAWRLGRLQAVRQLAWAQQQAAASATSGVAPHGESQADRQGRAPTGPAPFLSTDLPTFPPRSGLGSLQTQPGAAMNAALTAAGFAAPTPQPPPRGAVPGGTAQALPRGAAGLPDITPLDTPMARTEPMPAPLRGGDGGVRDVSIEELIDLEQQAEFFVVLGQDDAAVDLLVDHLRSTGGGSPLPYLKLLEIYSRTGDHGAYERNRARFNHRFNAYAPEWGSDLSHGRSLEDYPGILPRLEQVWPRPLDAMAELEALLFRKSRGELFELPAYREVLFLYALARDLLDREAADTGSVDLLLPLADGSAFGSTAPIPFLHEDLTPGDRNFDFDDRPTGPVDFDLTIPAQQTSMFDPMEEPPRPRRR